jgi:hypothetical protein
MLKDISPAACATLVKSISHSQREILDSIQRLHVPDGFECDATYGNGSFWNGVDRPRLCYDINPLFPFVAQADSQCLPVEAGSLGSLVFDPPFLTYIREQRDGNGKMALARRFSGYWRYDELQEHYLHSISEAYRVLRKSGVMVFKCQDIVHNHKFHCTHAMVITMAEAEGFRLADLYILLATHRMPSPNRLGTQKHGRIFHSYFLVLKKT